MNRILVVEHESNAGIGLVGERLAAAGCEITQVGPDVGTEVPTDPAGYDGVIVLGGTPGPTDDDDAHWLPRVRALIGACLDHEVPYLGICLGAQLLAVVGGGRVVSASSPEVGLTTMHVADAARHDPLLGGLPGEVEALQWHFLEISVLPPGSVALCSSRDCRNQAFRIGSRAWGVQFHMEALASTAQAWAREDSTDLRTVALTPADVIEPMQRAEQSLRARWSAVADRWIATVVAQRTDAR